jgi:butyryl-CoA dehydrogenase
MEEGRGLQLLGQRMRATIARAHQVAVLEPYAAQLEQALVHLETVTQEAWATDEPQDALANAVPYMQAFGHVVLAWVWLDVGLIAAQAQNALMAGKLGALRYFYHYELPKISAWLQVVRTRDLTCADFPQESF